MHIILQKKKHIIICLFFWVISLLYGEKTYLNDIIINSKTNGLVLEFVTDASVSDEYMSGWNSENGWFYITLFEFDGDSLEFYPKIIPREISNFQAIKLDKSIQIGIKTSKKIDYFEYQTLKGTKSLMATLHYPREVLAGINIDNPTRPINSYKKNIYSIKKWLYLTGITITATSFIHNDSDDFINIQTMIGSGIVTVTLILDLMNIL